MSKLSERLKFAMDNCDPHYGISVTQSFIKELGVLEEQLKEWDEERVPRLNLVGELIGSDWSGNEFDGRDVDDWIGLILDSKYDEFDDWVEFIAEDSILYNEIITKKEKKEK